MSDVLAGTTIDQIVIRNDWPEVEKLSGWIAARLDAVAGGEALTFALELCLDEVIANVIRHGYPEAERGHHDIVVRFVTLDDLLGFVTEDGGVPFNPLEVADPDKPRDLLEAEAGGLGVHLLRHYADRLAYAREGGRNRLTVLCRCKPGDGATSPS